MLLGNPEPTAKGANERETRLQVTQQFLGGVGPRVLCWSHIIGWRWSPSAVSKIMLQATPSSSTPKSEIPVKTSGGGFLAGGLCGRRGRGSLRAGQLGPWGACVSVPERPPRPPRPPRPCTEAADPQAASGSDPVALSFYGQV